MRTSELNETFDKLSSIQKVRLNNLGRLITFMDRNVASMNKKQEPQLAASIQSLWRESFWRFKVLSVRRVSRRLLLLFVLRSARWAVGGRDLVLSTLRSVVDVETPKLAALGAVE